MDLQGLRRDLDRKISARKAAWQKIKDEEAELERLEKAIQDTMEAQDHLQKMAQTIQQQAHERIAVIVSKCLNAVFDGMYELHIEFVRLRGRTEAKLIYRQGENEVDPLLTSGGVLDVSALALRVANLILAEPGSRKLLVLDEPATGVSAANLPKVGAMLEKLSLELGIQFIICTHVETLQIGKVIQF